MDEKKRLDFLADIGHEIRTPLNGITGFVELALSEELPDGVREYFERIQTCAQQLSDFAENLLGASTLESGSLTLNFAPFKLSRVVEGVCAASKKQAAHKGLELKTHIDGIEGLMLIGDGPRLRQALQNLVSNGIDAALAGDICVTARLLDEDDDRAVVLFGVSGGGTGEPRDGAELGVSIAQRLIALMGGRLESAAGAGGASFSFALPFIKAEEEARESAEDMKRPTFVGRVLVCEDNSMNRLVVNGHLSKTGLRYVNAEDGREALEAYERSVEAKEPFDLILMDVQMPVMDGLEATRRLRAAGCSVPIIAITANAYAEDREACADSGMAGFLAKPFTSQALWKVLAKYLKPVEYTETTAFAPVRPAVFELEPTLDRIRGVAFTAGDPQLYEYALADFFRDHMHAAEDIRFAAYAGELTEARRRVHTIKGASGMIGAAALHGAAAQLEATLAKAIKEGSEAKGDAALPDAAFAYFRSKLSDLLDALAEYAPSDKPRQVHAHSRSIPNIAETPQEFAKRLETMLSVGDASCADYAAELDGHFADAPQETLAELANAMEDYDFDKALEALEVIKAIIGG